MSVYNEQDELMRYGNDPDSCPECHESLTGRCKFHRETESSARWIVLECGGCQQTYEVFEPSELETRKPLCTNCRKKQQDEQDTDPAYPLSRSDA